MPVHHSAFKQIKKDRKRTLRNKQVKSALRTYIKKFNSLLEEKKFEEAKKYLQFLMAKISKAKTKGTIHKNTARRKISRLCKKLNQAISSHNKLTEKIQNP
ncbi:MAG: 30S ribosomal protein S20 [Candidatus Omnitrophica bacterium]|nr:30S ribosomal protein S20 [Candidatus Omnitrophota bacterium]MCM8793404.1 30S ribosomal protein S20 [Candidatus Omnitrophota bacterium]